MAKRKRLTPAQPGFLETRPAAALPSGVDGQHAPSPAPNAPPAPAPVPPIAQVARDSAASAALAEVSAELASARAEGRLIQAIPLDHVARDHLVRDRLVVDPDEMAALKDSLRARGQQTPVEVVDLGSGTYGLLSGWRRVTALGELHAETGEARFATVQALLRTPETAEAAYTAMVEENEIRVALSPYERARIVAQSVEQGVFPSRKQALQTLFSAASRAKRSKIGSFLPVVEALDGVLRFPGALTERLGLRLSKALSEAPEFGRVLRVRLRKAEGITEPGDEIAWLEAALLEATGAKAQPSAEIAPKGAASKPAKPGVAPAAVPISPPVHPAEARAKDAREVIQGVYLQEQGGAPHSTLTLSGPQVTAAFRKRLVAWLQEQT